MKLIFALLISIPAIAYADGGCNIAADLAKGAALDRDTGMTMANETTIIADSSASVDIKKLAVLMTRIAYSNEMYVLSPDEVHSRVLKTCYQRFGG